jgi:hypothetical protein
MAAGGGSPFEFKNAGGDGYGVLVGEVLEVGGDEEQVKDALVDEFEFGHGAAGLGMEDVEAEPEGLAGLRAAGRESDAEGVLDGIGQTGDEFHAAARAAAGGVLADVGVHGTEELDGFFGGLGWGLLGEAKGGQRKEGSAGEHGV